jgi:hypothetical protein
MNLHQKLSEIRKSVEYIQKTEKGNQGAMYVDPAVLLKTIRDKMDNYNILLIPSVGNSEIKQIDAPTKNNSNAKSYIYSGAMKYTWLDADDPEQNLSVPWFLTGKHMTDPAMAYGSALTFTERYFLLKFFQIPTSKDDPEFFEQKTGEKISEKQLIELGDIIEGKGYKIKPVLSQYCIKIVKINKIEDLPVSKFESAKDFFDAMDAKE